MDSAVEFSALSNQSCLYPRECEGANSLDVSRSSSPSQVARKRHSVTFQDVPEETLHDSPEQGTPDAFPSTAAPDAATLQRAQSRAPFPFLRSDSSTTVSSTVPEVEFPVDGPGDSHRERRADFALPVGPRGVSSVGDSGASLDAKAALRQVRQVAEAERYKGDGTQVFSAVPLLPGKSMPPGRPIVDSGGVWHNGNYYTLRDLFGAGPGRQVGEEEVWEPAPHPAKPFVTVRRRLPIVAGKGAVPSLWVASAERSPEAAQERAGIAWRSVGASVGGRTPQEAVERMLAAGFRPQTAPGAPAMPPLHTAASPTTQAEPNSPAQAAPLTHHQVAALWAASGGQGKRPPPSAAWVWQEHFPRTADAARELLHRLADA